MNKILKKYINYLEPISIKLISIFFIISSITCLVGLLLLSFYNTYFISIDLYESSLIIFRTGLMIGLFPTVFAIVIGKWKKEH